MTIMFPMPKSDVEDLEAVIRALDIEDRSITPAEAVEELHAEIRRLRAIEMRALEWMRLADTEIVVRKASPHMSDANRLAFANPVREALDPLRAELTRVDFNLSIKIARETWRALSRTQRKALANAAYCGGRLDRIGKEYRHREPYAPVSAATIRILCARNLMAWVGSPVDPKAAAIITDRGRIVAQYSREAIDLPVPR